MTEQTLFNFIWQIADLLRGPYRPPQYERVMLPMVVLRRFDCVLESTKKQVVAEYHWCVVRGKQILKERDERSDSGDEELLTVSHITGVTPRSENDVNMFEAVSKEGYKVCHKDDLAVNTMWAFMRAMVTGQITIEDNKIMKAERIGKEV